MTNRVDFCKKHLIGLAALFVLCLSLMPAAESRQPSVSNVNGVHNPGENQASFSACTGETGQIDSSIPGGQRQMNGKQEKEETISPPVQSGSWPCPTAPSQSGKACSSEANAISACRKACGTTGAGGRNLLSGDVAATAMMMAGRDAANMMNNPEANCAKARENLNQQNQCQGDNCAGQCKQQSQCAIEFIRTYLPNFTVNGANKWNILRNHVFIPMAVLLLLPGAVITQVKCTVAQGFPIFGEMSPIDGIYRSIVSVFLIPATYLIVNYGIDVSNSISFTIQAQYFLLFGSDMYRDAECAQIRAFPERQPSENLNHIPGRAANMAVPIGPALTSAFARWENSNVAVRLEDPCAGLNIVPPDRANEQVPYYVNAQRAGINGTNAALTTTWNILCAFQEAYLYYLWFVGPVMAALWVWPMKQLRDAFPNWCEGVITICFWSLFWHTTVLIMACFRGVDETGTLIMTALNFLSSACVKFAFDFAGLVKAAGAEAGKMAEKAMQGSQGGGGGGGGGGGTRPSEDGAPADSNTKPGTGTEGGSNNLPIQPQTDMSPTTTMETRGNTGTGTLGYHSSNTSSPASRERHLSEPPPLRDRSALTFNNGTTGSTSLSGNSSSDTSFSSFSSSGDSTFYDTTSIGMGTGTGNSSLMDVMNATGSPFQNFDFTQLKIDNNSSNHSIGHQHSLFAHSDGSADRARDFGGLTFNDTAYLNSLNSLNFSTLMQNMNGSSLSNDKMSSVFSNDSSTSVPLPDELVYTGDITTDLTQGGFTSPNTGSLTGNMSPDGVTVFGQSSRDALTGDVQPVSLTSVTNGQEQVTEAVNGQKAMRDAINAEHAQEFRTIADANAQRRMDEAAAAAGTRAQQQQDYVGQQRQYSMEAAPQGVQFTSLTPNQMTPNQTIIDEYSAPKVTTSYVSANQVTDTAPQIVHYSANDPIVTSTSTSYDSSSSVGYTSSYEFREAYQPTHHQQPDPIIAGQTSYSSYSNSNSNNYVSGVVPVPQETIIRRHNQEQQHEIIEQQQPQQPLNKPLEARPSQGKGSWMQQYFVSRSSVGAVNTPSNNSPQGKQVAANRTQPPSSTQDPYAPSQETVEKANESLNDVVARSTTANRYTRSSVEMPEKMTEEELEIMKKLGGSDNQA